MNTGLCLKVPWRGKLLTDMRKIAMEAVHMFGRLLFLTLLAS